MRFYFRKSNSACTKPVELISVAGGGCYSQSFLRPVEYVKVLLVSLGFLHPQIRYDIWRRVLKTFWAVVVGYSMVVLITVYMYQFRSVSALFRQIMGMSEEGWVRSDSFKPSHFLSKRWKNQDVSLISASLMNPVWFSRLRDLGLERYGTVELFARILLPAAFLLACILQLHYFNSDFLTLTDLDNVPVREISRLAVNVTNNIVFQKIEIKTSPMTVNGFFVKAWGERHLYFTL